jgi:ribonuclease D
VHYDLLTTESELNALCDRLRSAPWIGLDTEFVSEFTYHPQLCLVQVSADGLLAIIDAQAVSDLTPFWRVLVSGDQEVIVHSGREEFRFCLRATGKSPANWFDCQLAAGMVGLEYPASYSTLLRRLTGEKLPKHETRTDWRRRPLSESQLRYALQDVIHLEAISGRLRERLIEHGRLEWFRMETDSWKREMQESGTRQRWRGVSGTSGLPESALTIVRRLWGWREAEAERRDCPPRRVLRDDLLVELARRGRSDIHQIRAIRGMDRRDLRRHLREIASCIHQARRESPPPREQAKRDSWPAQVDILAQFLNTALSEICHEKSIAPGLVGTLQDIRESIAFHLGLAADSLRPPRLTQGWRAELVGNELRDLLDGKIALRVLDPRSESPLAFERFHAEEDTRR